MSCIDVSTWLISCHIQIQIFLIQYVNFFIETHCYAIRLYLIYILYVSQLCIILLQCLLELPSFIMSSLDFPLNLHDYSWVGKRIQTSHQAFPDAPWLGGKQPTVLFPTWSPLTSWGAQTTTADWELKSWVSRERTVLFHDKGMVEIQSACWFTLRRKTQIRGKES